MALDYELTRDDGTTWEPVTLDRSGMFFFENTTPEPVVLRFRVAGCPFDVPFNGGPMVPGWNWVVLARPATEESWNAHARGEKPALNWDAPRHPNPGVSPPTSSVPT